MPGRDYTRAYALFEQSLGDTFLSTPHKDQYRRQQGVRVLDTPSPSRSIKRKPAKQFNEDKIEHRSSTLPISHQYVSNLPPTPPSNTRSTKAYTPWTESPIASYNVRVSSLSTPTTPTDPKVLPTPETTPPHSSDHLTLKYTPTIPSPSPYAESFKTAMEEQRSVDDDWNRSLLVVDYIPSSKASQGPQHLFSTVRNHQANSQHHQPNVQIPVARALRYKPNVQDFDQVLGESQSVVRKRGSLNDDGHFHPHGKPMGKLGQPGNPSTSLSDEIRTNDEKDAIPLLMRGLSMRKDWYDTRKVSSQSNACGNGQREYSLQTVQQDLKHFGERETKRDSDTSSSSIVVKAIVIDRTPARRKAKLRHVSKTVDLREEAFHSDHSARQSLDSDESAISRVLNEEKYILDEIRPNATGSDALQSTASHLLRRVGNITSTSQPPRLPSSSRPGREMHCQRTMADMRQIRRKSFDQSSIGTESLHQSSYDQSRNHILTPPHMRVGSSPLSFFSEGLEVDEATAVSIYPHHNNSLLVVQHRAVADPLHQHPIGPFTRIQLPPPGFLSHAVPFGVDTDDSRAPPTFAIIPPTPADELDIHDASIALDKQLAAAPPSRRASLLKRARQYSDTVIQPLVTFTALNAGSLRRSITLRRYYYGARPHTSSPRARDLSHPDNRLHPFWQPRGFWDDLSDDEGGGSEDDNYYNPAEDGDGEDRLPAGGDTREVVVAGESSSPVQVGFGRWRLGRGGSLRGFLIGNSLGLERGPTNRRRHVVRWPTGKKRRRVGGGAWDEDGFVGGGGGSDDGRGVEVGREADSGGFGDFRRMAPQSAEMRMTTGGRRSRRGGASGMVRTWRERMLTRRVRW